MLNTSNGLWLCVNPYLNRFDQHLCAQLGQNANVWNWMYQQTSDEPCCIETALALLHDYLEQQTQPLHLIGHGLSGTLGLLYARKYPHHLKSLTLLSVGATPSINWQAHYYALRKLLPCDREIVLVQMVRTLFGPQQMSHAKCFAKLLERVLDTELTPHSLATYAGLAKGGITVSLLVCRGEYDTIIDPNAYQKWQQWLKPGDRLWTCPQGRHFFHHNEPQRCSQVILDFWQQIGTLKAEQSMKESELFVTPLGKSSSSLTR
ncbi:MAG: alpha/beta hydrolase [Cyanobacteria bacterium P01_E01_bin.6]